MADPDVYNLLKNKLLPQINNIEHHLYSLATRVPSDEGGLAYRGEGLGRTAAERSDARRTHGLKQEEWWKLIDDRTAAERAARARGVDPLTSRLLSEAKAAKAEARRTHGVEQEEWWKLIDDSTAGAGAEARADEARGGSKKSKKKSKRKSKKVIRKSKRKSNRLKRK